MGLTVVGAGITALFGWARALTGHLIWDGQHWRLQSADHDRFMADHNLQVMADFQNFLLVRIENPGYSKAWLWVQRGTMPTRWVDMRRAAYSPNRASVAGGMA